MSRTSPSALRAWPWWLWAEHFLLLGFAGWNAVGLWRVFNRTRKQTRIAKASDLQRAGIRPQVSLDDKSEQELQHKPEPETPKASGRSLGGLADGSIAMEVISRAVQASLARLKSLSGPSDVLTWSDVTPGPPASVDMRAVAEGQAASFLDGRGIIYKFKLAEDVHVNMYYTKAGFRRSGDLHNCNQYDVVLRGRTRLRMIDPHTGREVVQEYGANDFIVIPARTPHMFEFLEDNYLLEWWDDTFRAWYYKPYRTVIEQGLPLAYTAGRDFSTRLPPPPHLE